MPGETALGHTQAPCQRFHRDGTYTLFSNQVEGRLGPVFGTQAAVAAGARFAGGSYAVAVETVTGPAGPPAAVHHTLQY
ncbi:hypothetical protein G6F32_017291 [Rhizopus arrhizus]|nr:hypothetical protein G6F32_017291 [Rhizopus arrhizus]